RSGLLTGNRILVFRVIGLLLIIIGIAVWFIGALKSDMDENITENKLKTDGIYAWVRNPMYSGWWIIISGTGLMCHNLWLLVIPFINWGIMTVVLINTEEKWLKDLYGKEYEDYLHRVNRCIPRIPRK
ncbi:MAG: isoprenylcysteine carboxylmethyltransferase family protein, partial [Lachnospiraceae bacterium]|nr:isoprenylcysteine carboxylmethyltransferase family protein [Lachnospiraceae bacterium]